PDGCTVAVSRSLYLKSPPPYHREIWLIDIASGRKREIFHLRKPQLAPPYLYGFSPDGRWLITFEDTQNSASLAADGLPLFASPASARQGRRARPRRPWHVAVRRLPLLVQQRARVRGRPRRPRGDARRTHCHGQPADMDRDDHTGPYSRPSQLQLAGLQL